MTDHRADLARRLEHEVYNEYMDRDAICRLFREAAAELRRPAAAEVEEIGKALADSADMLETMEAQLRSFGHDQTNAVGQIERNLRAFSLLRRLSPAEERWRTIDDPAEIAGHAIYLQFKRTGSSEVTRHDNWDKMPEQVRADFIAEGRAAIEALVATGLPPTAEMRTEWDGPPCPTCGFRKLTWDRPPIDFDGEADIPDVPDGTDVMVSNRLVTCKERRRAGFMCTRSNPNEGYCACYEHYHVRHGSAEEREAYYARYPERRGKVAHIEDDHGARHIPVAPLIR